jgi:hypothetical protein
MYTRVLIFLGASALFAADERELALALRAQSDFDRVELGVHPQLQETNACIQSQVAVLSVAPRAELSSLYFRKGYCTLLGATLTHGTQDFLEAAGAFDKSMEAWPDAIGPQPKTVAIEPVSSGLRILAAVSRIEADPAQTASGPLRREVAAALDPTVCPSSVMSTSLCQSLTGIGHEWLGWIALQNDDLWEARKEFSLAPQGPWQLWTAGRQAFRDRNYQAASSSYQKAMNLWAHAQENGPTSLPVRISPQPDMPLAWTQLGAAQMLSGNPVEAISSLDSAIKAKPNLARAIFYRARAEELAGRAEAALNDYNLASRTAFANAQDLMSGEAHLYRGIAYFRRKDFAHAEDEFSSALNFGIPPEIEGDARAWRYMAAVAGGACGASRRSLEDALTHASAFFPKQEARSLAATCPLSG